MKRFALLTIPLIAAVIATGSISANAAVGGTIYPEDSEFIKELSLSSLNDYAIGDGLFAFADGEYVKVYDDGNYSEYAFIGDVTAVDIDEDGVVYCRSEEKTYSLPGQTECEYDEFDSKVNRLLCGDYLYNVLEGKLYVSYLLTPEAPPAVYSGKYSNLKQYGDKVYAINGNSLYAFNGSQGEEVVLEYAVDKADLKITIGQASSSLKEYSEVRFVEIEEGAFMTEVDLEKLDGEYFVPLNIVKAEKGTYALLLSYSGNAAIVSIKNTGYVVAQSKVKEITIDPTTENPYKNAQMIGGKIYASPFVASGTVANSEAAGLIVKVLHKLDYESILECPFYEVEYQYGEKTVKGYVAEGFLSSVLIKDDNPPKEISDPDYSDDSDTKTILIIFAVVVLVLAAIAYIAHVSSKGKKKGKKKKETESEEE